MASESDHGVLFRKSNNKSLSWSLLVYYFLGGGVKKRPIQPGIPKKKREKNLIMGHSSNMGLRNIKDMTSSNGVGRSTISIFALLLLFFLRKKNELFVFETFLLSLLPTNPQKIRNISGSRSQTGRQNRPQNSSWMDGCQLQRRMLFNKFPGSFFCCCGKRGEGREGEGKRKKERPARVLLLL